MRRWAGVLSVAVVVAVSCGPLDLQRPTSIESTDSAAAVVSDLQRLWAQDEVGGGFGRADLNMRPSLYATAWNLRLAKIYGVAVPNLDRERTAAWLRGVITRPTEPPGVAADGLPPLQRILLATQALVDMAVPSSQETVALAVAPFSVDGMYRYRAGDSPSWAATLAAVESLRLTGAQVPDGTRSVVHRALKSATTPTSEQSILSTLLPLWQLADRLLAEAERRPLVPALSQLLRKAVASVQSQAELSGSSVVVLALIREVSVENGIAAGELGVAFERLQTPGGYLSLQARALPDPQVTYYAAVLGMPMPQQFRQTLVLGAGSDGWRAGALAPDPEASFQVLAVLHAFHDEHFDPPLRIRTERWMSEVNEESLRSSAGRRRALYITLVAGELRLSYPESLRDAYRNTFGATGTLETADLLMLFRGASQIGIPIPPAARRSAAEELGRTPQRSMRDLFMRAALGRFLGDEGALAQAAIAAADFQIGPLYRFVRERPEVELRATCAGLWLRHGDSAAAAERFWGRGGTWLLPPTVSTGNVITTDTIYLGFVLRGVIQGAHSLAGDPLCFV